MLSRCEGFRTGGKLHSVQGTIHAGLTAAVGDLCEIVKPCADIDADPDAMEVVLGEVIGCTPESSQIMTFFHPHGIRPQMDVISTGRSLRVPVGRQLLGRTINGLGQPVDQGPPLTNCRTRPMNSRAPAAMLRQPVSEPIVTGQRAIDGMLTLGRGQRVGLFAGSGVGKSTLMGEIAKHAQADMNVIVLVGERGREVRPFITDCLGEEGRERSVMIVATSDETPLMRIQAVRTGIEIASEFRRQGASVLFFLDSVTRLAHAQRELGLSRGEPPGTRGYPPSVMNLLATVLEKLGNDECGSITGIITVLVDGDDHDEPIADAARSILDGHLVLDRDLAVKGHFPALNVLKSVSRLASEVTTNEHKNAVAVIRNLMATYEETRELIQTGLYSRGTVPHVDLAIDRMPDIERFLKQDQNEFSDWETTTKAIQQLVL